MQLQTLTAETIASWERLAGPTPVHGVEVSLANGGRIEPHSHKRGQIMLVRSGVITVNAEGRCWVISGARALWIPEGVPHQILASTSVDLSNLQVSRKLAPNLPTKTGILATTGLFRELMVCAAAAGAKQVCSGTREQKIIDLLLAEFQLTDEVALVVPEPTDPRLKRVCSALRRDPSDARTLAELAESAGGCTRTLGRLFIKETGMTFAQWRRQVRLLEAIIRLSGGQSVTATALDAGYENASAFIEMFRRVMGRTPGQYFDG